LFPVRWFALLLALFVAVGCASRPSEAEQPKVSEGEYVSRDKAAEAALVGTQNLAVKGVQFVAQYPLEHAGNGAKGAVWVVELISTPDQRPQGKAIVDAVSGKVLSVSNAPSGQ
jgi:hypothetical protein